MIPMPKNRQKLPFQLPTNSQTITKYPQVSSMPYHIGRMASLRVKLSGPKRSKIGMLVTKPVRPILHTEKAPKHNVTNVMILPPKFSP